MSSEQTPRNSPIHPDFDGHLEHPIDGPLTNENILARLKRAWEGALLLQWARRVKKIEKSPDEDPQPRDDKTLRSG